MGAVTRALLHAAVVAGLTLQACTLPVDPTLTGPPSALRGMQALDAQVPLEPTASFFYVPAFAVESDVDESEPGMGILFDADLDTGTGWGVRGGFDAEGAGPGGMFITTTHDENNLGGDVRTYSAYVEYVFGSSIGTGDVSLRPVVGIGIGAAVFDFDSGFDDTGGAAGQARVGFELEMWHRAVLGVGAAGFLWGYPGETIGYGGYATLELGIRF